MPTDSIADSDLNDRLALVQAAFDMSPYGAEVERALHEAGQRLASACMNQAGYEYIPIPAQAEADASEFADALALFPPTPSRAAVEREGYAAFAPPPGATSGESSEEVDALFEAVDNVAGYGDALSSCSEQVALLESEISAYRARELYRSVFLPEFIGIMDHVAATPAVQQEIAAWTECMLANGYQEADPRDAVERNRLAAAEGTAIQQAIADIECREHGGLRQSEIGAAAAYVTSVLEAHPSELLELRAATEAESKEILDAIADWDRGSRFQ